MDDNEAIETEERILGYARVEFDLRSAVASLRPGESLKIKPGEFVRRVPILVVEDESWRTGLAP